ncbi:helix-turn-helix domain-containing protein [Enterococcus faecium]|uniref:helix-turn-helix domain-containing protein n=1 Tax=Enterococcus faecium TaxID=1352 RepID=UPI001F5135D8|nr:helix-turn-helix domain-containing protein [Enterococcus faecium]
MKQKHCADHFGISVNTLKLWVTQGCPEIRLATGTPMYSKSAIEEWLRSQKNKK